MKKLSLIITIALTAIIFCGCGGKDASSNTPPPQNYDVEKLEIEFYDYSLNKAEHKSVWQFSDAIYLDVNIFPNYATDRTIKWTSSDSNIADVWSSWSSESKEKGAYYIHVGDPGNVTLTATASNGISTSVTIEVKQKLSYNFELPLVITQGSGSYLRRYTITDISYHREKEYQGYFLICGSKTYDAKGNNNATSGLLLNINIYDNSNVVKETKPLFLPSLLTGDNFKEKVYVSSLLYSGAPYTAKLIIST